MVTLYTVPETCLKLMLQPRQHFHYVFKLKICW